MLTSNIALVIGPDTAGDRGDGAGDIAYRFEVDVATQTIFRVRVVPTSTTTAPGLTRSAVIRLGYADGAHQQIRLAGQRTEIGCPRVGDRHGGVGATGAEHQRQWPANQEGAADDHGAAAGCRQPMMLQESEDSARGARSQTGAAENEQTEVVWVETVDVLGGVDSFGDGVGIESLREEEAAPGSRGRRDRCSDSSMTASRCARPVSAGKFVMDAADADLFGVASLVPYVEVRRRVVSHQHCGETRIHSQETAEPPPGGPPPT